MRLRVCETVRIVMNLWIGSGVFGCEIDSGVFWSRIFGPLYLCMRFYACLCLQVCLYVELVRLLVVHDEFRPLYLCCAIPMWFNSRLGSWWESCSCDLGFMLVFLLLCVCVLGTVRGSMCGLRLRLCADWSLVSEPFLLRLVMSFGLDLMLLFLQVLVVEFFGLCLLCVCVVVCGKFCWSWNSPLQCVCWVCNLYWQV